MSHHSYEQIFQQARQYHDPFFNEHVARAHDFATRQLGLQPATPERVVVVSGENQRRVRDITGAEPSHRGGFNQQSGGIVLFPQADSENPEGATVRAESDIVHELTHSATDNPYHHVFFREALAGMAEAKYLAYLGKHNRWRPALGFTLRRAGVELLLPGNFRYYDAPDANTSQGLVAGLGVAYGMRASDMTVADIMNGSSYGGERQFTMMKGALNSLQKGLAKEVETLSQDTDGIVQATKIIHDAAMRR